MSPSPHPMPPFPPSDHLGVKICGITLCDQATAIADLGADALGLNFWPKSKRYLPLETARDWAPALLDRVHLVAVLVNPEPSLLAELTAGPPVVHTLQLHGDEPPALVSELLDRGVRVIKALQVRDAASLDAIADYACTDILLDAYNPGLYGGGGEPFPWHLATLARERFPAKRILLSGGLTADNVAQAVAQTHPAAVDVASGVESAPGIKDLDQVAAFIRNARA